MEPVVSMVMLWALFAGTHIGLATGPVRGLLVGRLGERGFGVLFSLVAAVSFTLLVTYYATHRLEGPPGLALGSVAPIRWALIVMIVATFGLLAASLAHYPRSPYALFSKSAVAEPRGIERITRHGFFAAVGLFAVAHSLLATRLIGTVFSAGLAVLALLGAWHQDRKFLARRGAGYASYLAVTSVLPFAAILTGRQRLVPSELPLRVMVLGLGAGVLLRLGHDDLFAWDGLGIVAVVVGGAAIATLQSLRRGQRRAGRVPATGQPTMEYPAPRALDPRSGRILALLLIAAAVGHAAIGVALFREPLAAMWQAGIVNSISPSIETAGVPDMPVVHLHFDRVAAFWFLIVVPVLILLAQVLHRAAMHRDARLTATVGWYLVGLGFVGIVVMPISGFWLLLAIGMLTIRTARTPPYRPVAASGPRPPAL